MLGIVRNVRPSYKYFIGNREVVGPSWTTKDLYYDRVEHPLPPITFREPTQEVMALREKEKGDWKKLTIDEKKTLYRHNFCQTMAEMEAPRYETRRVVGAALTLMMLPICLYAIVKKTLFPPLPDTLSDQGKKNIVRFYIDARVEPQEGGISSYWDYEKQQWKSKPYLLMKNK